MEKAIKFHLTIPEFQLSQLLTQALDDSIGDDSIEVNSIRVSLKRVGNVILQTEGKTFTLRLPYDVTLFKEAGLFSVEAKGAVELDLKINYEISHNLRLSTRTQLIKYTWLTKPKLELGIVNLPLEKLLDVVIRHYEPVITAKIDSKIKEFSNLRLPLNSIDVALGEKLSQIDLNGIYPDFKLEKIGLQTIFKDDNKVLHLSGMAVPDIKINTFNRTFNIKDTSFEWVGDLTNNAKVNCKVILTYDFLAKSIIDNLPDVDVAGQKLELAFIDIKNIDTVLVLESMILQPIKGDVTIKFKPSFNIDTQELTVIDVSVDVQPKNFIYKMTAPLVNTFISNKIKSIFPLSIDVLLDKYVEPMIPNSVSHPYGVVNFTYDTLCVDDLEFDEDGLFLDASVSNLLLNSHINYEI